MIARWATGVAAAALMAASGADAADLTLKRVLLSTGGVGLYEYEADVDGDATVDLKATLDQIDDILKSLVVFDDHGGVGGLDLPGSEPLNESFRALPFTAADLQSTPQLLSALRGAEVEVGAPRALRGRIVAVAEEIEAKSSKRHRVTVMTDAGLESFVLEDADSVRFADPALRESLDKALKAVAADSAKDSRTLRLRSKGDGKRALHVAYLAAAPVWKTTYRLVLDPDRSAKKAVLQGWATLENFSGQDWDNVELTLVSGRPVAYRQDLYRAYMVQRPEAPLDVGPQLNPRVDNGAIAAPAPLPTAAAAPRFAMRAPPPATDGSFPAAKAAAPLSAGAELVTAQESETQVSFPLPFPVSVGAGRTLSLPIVDGEAQVERVAIYDRAVDQRHPLSAAEFKNVGSTSLPPGVVTIYERGDAGATYVGDSRLSATPAGETRLLSYALDQKTTINEDDSDHGSLVKARVAKGVLTIDELTRRRTDFIVKANEPRRLVVFASKLEGGKLTEPKTPGVTEADGRYRVPFDVPVGDGQIFTVEQQRTQRRAVALADLGADNLAFYAKSGEVDPDSRAQLVKLADLRAKQADAEKALNDTKTQIEAVQNDQSRLKDLLGAVTAGTDLSKRYLRKLDADETELESLNATLTQRQNARDAAARDVEAFVAQR